MSGQRAMPILPAADVAASAAFYMDKLGFTLAGSWQDDAGDSFAIVQMGLVTLGLTRSDRSVPDSEWAAYVYVADINAFADHAMGKGAPVKRGPEISFYKCNELEVIDPAGNVICFAQDMAPGADGPGL